MGRLDTSFDKIQELKFVKYFGQAVNREQFTLLTSSIPETVFRGTFASVSNSKVFLNGNRKPGNNYLVAIQLINSGSKFKSSST